MAELSIEDINGVIVVSYHGEMLGQTLSVPVFAFSNMDALKRFAGMLNEFIEKNTIDIPQYIKEAFKDEE